MFNSKFKMRFQGSIVSPEMQENCWIMQIPSLSPIIFFDEKM